MIGQGEKRTMAPKKGPSERSSGRRNRSRAPSAAPPPPLREPRAQKRRGKGTCRAQRNGLVPIPPTSSSSFPTLAFGPHRPRAPPQASYFAEPETTTSSRSRRPRQLASGDNPRRRAPQRAGSGFALCRTRSAGLADVPRETHPRRRPTQRAGSGFVLRRARNDGLVPIPPASPACLGRRPSASNAAASRLGLRTLPSPKGRPHRRASEAGPSASTSAASGLRLRASPSPKPRPDPDPASLASVPRETHPRQRPAQQARSSFVLRPSPKRRARPDPAGLASVPREPDPRRRAARRAGSGFVLRRARSPIPPASPACLGRRTLGIDQRRKRGQDSCFGRSRNARLVPIPPASPACLGRRTLGVDQRSERARASCFAEHEVRSSQPRQRASGGAPSASTSAGSEVKIRASAEAETLGSSRSRRPRRGASGDAPSASTSAADGLGLRASPNPKRRALPDPAGLASVPRETHPRHRPAQQAGSDFVLRRARNAGLVPISPASPACLGMLTLGGDQRRTQARAWCFAEPEATASSRARRPRLRGSKDAPSAPSSAASGLGLRASPSLKRRARPVPAGRAPLGPEHRPEVRPGRSP